MNWIAWQPWRKPVMLLVLMVVLIIVITYAHDRGDIADNLTDVIKTLIYVCIGGYFGTSSVEAIKGHQPPKEDPPKLDNEE